MSEIKTGSLWRDESNDQIYLLALCAFKFNKPEGKRDRFAAIGISTANRWCNPTSDIRRAVKGLVPVNGRLIFKEDK